MKPIPLLYDGDMGGDDLWSLGIILGNRDKINLLGIASVFGNVSQPHATQNVLDFLHWLRIEDIRVVQGVNSPYDGMTPVGDDAYGASGVGDVIFPKSSQLAETQDIADWYAAILRNQSDPVTIAVTGPATNVALFLERYPQLKSKIHEIVIMAGGFEPPGSDGKPVKLNNGKIRKGNITPYAEFNAYQDPKALNVLLESGVKCVFMSADATQHLILTPERQASMRMIHPLYGEAFNSMLKVVENLDRSKFGVGPFIHDPNVATHLLSPELYSGSDSPGLMFVEAPPENEHRGEVLFGAKNTKSSAIWLNGIKDQDFVFSQMEGALRRVIIDALKDNPARLAE
jgi:inosine-uridine nucleoside N-ribohydrolase